MPEPNVVLSTLLVEDDQHKLHAIEGFLRGLSGAFDMRVSKSYQNALKTVRDWKPLLILLDMSLPTYEDGGGRPRPFAGKELLHEIRRRKILTNVIVVTQFDSFGEGAERKTLDQLRTELMQQYREWYQGIVYYNPAESAWRDALNRLIMRVRGSL